MQLNITWDFKGNKMHEIGTVIDKVYIYNKKNDTMSEFPVILATNAN